MVAAAGDPERLERLQHTCRQSPVGSSAALALQSPQAPEGQSAWLRGELTGGELTCWQALLHPVHWDYQQCPAVSFPIAPLCTRLISGRELDTHTGATALHHSCLSKMPTEQVLTGRLLFIYLALSFPHKTSLGECHQGKAEQEALAGPEQS